MLPCPGYCNSRAACSLDPEVRTQRHEARFPQCAAPLRSELGLEQTGPLLTLYLPTPACKHPVGTGCFQKGVQRQGRGLSSSVNWENQALSASSCSAAQPAPTWLTRLGSSGPSLSALRVGPGAGQSREGPLPDPSSRPSPASQPCSQERQLQGQGLCLIRASEDLGTREEKADTSRLLYLAMC